jgi:hypothetical protein
MPTINGKKVATFRILPKQNIFKEAATVSGGDDSQPDGGYLPKGKARVLGGDDGVNSSDDWFVRGGYTQTDFPKADAIYASDDENQITFKIKTKNNARNLNKPTTYPLGFDDVDVTHEVEKIEKAEKRLKKKAKQKDSISELISDYSDLLDSLFESDGEDDKYVHVGYGKYKEKSKKDVEGAPLFKKDDSGKYSPIGGDDKGGEAKPTGQAVQGADMFKHDKSVKQPKEEPKQEPTKSSSDTAEVANKLKNRKTKNGEELDIDVTPNGSLIIGVEHGKRKKSNKETIEQIKTLPKDTKVMFVGEGGMSKDKNGNIEFGGEQNEFRNAVKGHFDNAEESSWDENADVLDDKSPVFDEVANVLGGSKSKAKAALWSNMYGQDGPDENMTPEDYLDDEGKEWLIDQAKKGGSSEFDGDVDWNNLTDAQQKDLYELNYNDEGKMGDNEIIKAQEAYNGFRQKELDRKIKEAEDAGYTVIAPVGNSHVDMRRQRNKKKDTQDTPKTDKNVPNSLSPKVDINKNAPMAFQKIKDGVQNWSLDEKQFFIQKVHKGESPERRSFGEAVKDKAKGALEAIKHGAKHEVHLFKEAGSGVKNFFSGGKVSDSEKKALISVAKKVALAAAFGAAGGGLAHGAAAFGKHLMVEFIPHVVVETIAIGAGKAALFAGEEEPDADMLKFIDIISKKLESAKIPNDVMASAIESFNSNKDEKGDIKENYYYDGTVNNYADWARTHPRKYDSKKTNFKVKDSGQPGLEDDLEEIAVQVNKIPGGLSTDKKLTDFATKYNTTVDVIKQKIKDGAKVEMEHTTDVRIATEIAKDHIWEDLNYYTKLKKVENGVKSEMAKTDMDAVEKYADSQMNPTDVDLGKETDHFFQRLNDPRNGKEISPAELTGLFKRLARNKKKFLEFLKQYKEFVVKDRVSNINIAFIKVADRLIAKTVMRKADFKSSTPVFTTESLIMEGGAYGHMNHPFDTEINLTFGQLKDIVNRALDGNLEFAREKTDGQALAISWIDGRLVAARNKSHLKNKGAGALDINGVADKFAGRGELTDAYNFAMKDLSNAIKSLSQAQKDKVFKNGSCFMNIEVIYPTSVNVIPYGQPLLVFHGTMEYDENGDAIGESAEAGRVLGGMLKQVNADVQSKYTLQGPPVLKLPKSQDLSSKKGKYLTMISKLQKEFGLGDTAGVANYHQAWWENFVDKKSPTTLDNATKMGLVKRWAFNEKGFRIDKNSIKDEKTLAWATKIDKEDHKGISKDNLMKFEDIFLGVGADVLEFTASVLTVNPDSALRDMKKRLEQTIKDVQASGDPKKIDKLKLELKRLNAIGGAKRIVPIEGIVFVYNGQTFKLTGAFASLNQLLGIFYA